MKNDEYQKRHDEIYDRTIGKAMRDLNKLGIKPSKGILNSKIIKMIKDRKFNEMMIAHAISTGEIVEPDQKQHQEIVTSIKQLVVDMKQW